MARIIDDVNYDLNEIQINGEKRISLSKDDLQKGSNYILVQIPAGRYEIKKIMATTHNYFKLGDELWEFEVKPATISYVGDLEITQRLWGRLAYFELINRSSIALEFLEEHFPKLVNTRKVQYGGLGEDRFFEVIADPATKESGESK